MSYVPEAPRFLPFAINDAVSNMALDEAILETHLQGFVPATLRLYGFSPPAVSIGYGQHLNEEAVKTIRAKGFDIVRRPTGGRAVLHLGDLTYSFICSSIRRGKNDVTRESSIIDSQELDLLEGQEITNDHANYRAMPAKAASVLVSRSIGRAYQEICAALIAALAQFGLNLELGVSQSDYRHSQDCFEATTPADLHYMGKKIIGSAQLRRKDAVLQHGSLILNQPQDLMTELLIGTQASVRSAPNGLAAKTNRHANLFEVLGAEIAIEQLQAAFLKGFEEAFAFRFQISDLTDKEIQLAKELGAKYAVTPS